jgi:hypothetical protein
MLTVSFAVAGLHSSLASACQTFDSYNLTLCFDYYGSMYVRLPQVNRTLFKAETETFFTTHADNIEFQRNELHLIVDQHSETLSQLVGFPVSWHVELRPWYDSTYDLPDTVGQGKFHSYLADQLETNLNGRMAEYYDPLFREYYVDLTPRHFFLRVGRQIIAWGKSDGVYMLDILNNFNLVNPEIFNEQLVKIPVWAANINWQASATGTLQLIFVPQYIPTYYAGLQFVGGFPRQGGYGDFTYNAIALVNNTLNGSLGFKVPTNVNMPSARLNNWTYASRWSDQFRGVHYTLNYLYTWTTTMIYYPNTGTYLTATAVNLHPHRIHIAGGSADYDVDIGNRWLDGTVFRMESAVTTGDVYYEGLLGNPVDVTHWGFLGGVDKIMGGDYLERPVFVSFQYWQDWVLRRNNHCVCLDFSNKFQDIGFFGGHSGLRGLYKSLSTLFLDKTWTPADLVDTSLAVVYDWQFGDWWIKPQVSYRLSDYTTFIVGSDVFAGPKQSPYGEFTNASNIYFELHQVIR